MSTETENQSTESTMSLDQMLSGAHQKVTGSEDSAQESAVETKDASETTEAAAEVTETKQEPAAAQGETPQAAAEPAKDEEKEGFRKGMFAEREKRQYWEQDAKLKDQRIRELESTLSQYQPQPFESEVATQPQPQVDQRHLALSVQLARSAHPNDFDEKWRAFQEAVLENPALEKTAEQSVLPGEAAYQIGQNYLLEKQYGKGVLSNPMKMREALEKELIPKITKEVTDKVTAKFTGKAVERNNTPTDFSGARSAGGATQTEFVPKDLNQMLREVHHRGR